MELGKLPKVVGYIRVSSKQQVINGCGQNAQRDEILFSASRFGLDVTKWFYDVGSGAKINKGLSIAMEYAKKECVGVIVADVDRLTRNKDHGDMIWNAFNKVVFSCRKGLMNKIAFDLLVHQAHAERESIRARTQAGMNRLKRLEALKKENRYGEHAYEKMLEKIELKSESIIDYVNSYSPYIRFCEDNGMQDTEIVEALNYLYGQPGERIWTSNALKRFRQVEDSMQFV